MVFVPRPVAYFTQHNALQFHPSCHKGQKLLSFCCRVFHCVDPAISPLGLYSKNPETPIEKSLYIPMFIAAQFTIAKCWKQPKCPSVNERIKKLWYIYTMEYCAAERKKELLPFVASWIELDSIMLSEISQAVRDKFHMISPLTGT